jgi:16S rRNA (cytosine1402-N4)-methyltransferase
VTVHVVPSTDRYRLMRSPSTSRVGVPFSARFHFATSGRNPDGMPVGGLRMSRFEHRPVMRDEIVELLVAAPEGVYLDATLGGAGHATAVLDAAPQLRLVGLDQDPDAVEAASAALARFGARATVVHSRFDRVGPVLDSLGVEQVTAALFDLGVSSPQLDRAERGFSYRAEGALDMRMDTGAPVTAADVVNGWAEAELTRLFREHGESRFAARIAGRIVAARPIGSTTELAEVVRAAIPAATRRTGGHPARRVFQAVRVAVNDELSILPGALDEVLDRLATGGRMAVLAYHSGEDRIVKDRFRNAVTGGCVCPPGLPCGCGAIPVARLLTRGARRPSAEEVGRNRRAESARLRAVEGLR